MKRYCHPLQRARSSTSEASRGASVGTTTATPTSASRRASFFLSITTPPSTLRSTMYLKYLGLLDALLGIWFLLLPFEREFQTSSRSRSWATTTTSQTTWSMYSAAVHVGHHSQAQCLMRSSIVDSVVPLLTDMKLSERNRNEAAFLLSSNTHGQKLYFVYSSQSTTATTRTAYLMHQKYLDANANMRLHASPCSSMPR